MWCIVWFTFLCICLWIYLSDKEYLSEREKFLRKKERELLKRMRKEN